MHTLSKSQAFGCARKLLLVGLVATAPSGCETPTGTGAGIGALLGGGIGALAGHCPGAALAGAAIGAGAGAIGGAAAEAHQERKAERAAAYTAAVRAPNLQQVADMTHQSVPPSVIIEQIRTSGAVYQLTPEQTTWLSQQGVHPDVIRAMQDSGLYYRPRRVYGAPPPVMVVEPVYAPPPVVGVGVVGGWR
jgi:outer membrane lipoprotein SlyB